MYRLLLKTIGKWLPISHSRFFGFLGKWFRYLCASKISNGIGNNVNIEKGAVIQKDTIIGDNSGVGINCQLSPNVQIGENVMMGPECLFYTSNHRFDKETRKYVGYTDAGRIVIQNDVWIGARCIFIGDVIIGKGSTIGAGSVVTKDVPP